MNEVEDKALRTAERWAAITRLLPKQLRCPIGAHPARVSRRTCLECVRVDAGCSATRQYLVAGGIASEVALDAERGPEAMVERVVVADQPHNVIDLTFGPLEAPPQPPPVNPRTGKSYSSWAYYRRAEARRKTEAAKKAAPQTLERDLAASSARTRSETVARVLDRARASDLGLVLGSDGLQAEPVTEDAAMAAEHVAAEAPSMPEAVPEAVPEAGDTYLFPRLAKEATYRLSGSYAGHELHRLLSGMAEGVNATWPSRWVVRVDIERVRP